MLNLRLFAVKDREGLLDKATVESMQCSTSLLCANLGHIVAKGVEGLPHEATVESMQRIHLGIQRCYCELRARSLDKEESRAAAVRMAAYSDVLFDHKMAEMSDHLTAQYRERRAGFAFWFPFGKLLYQRTPHSHNV